MDSQVTGNVTFDEISYKIQHVMIFQFNSEEISYSLDSEIIPNSIYFSCLLLRAHIGVDYESIDDNSHASIGIWSFQRFNKKSGWIFSSQFITEICKE